MVDGNTTPLTAALSKGSASVKTFESGATKAFNAVGVAAVVGLAYAGKQFIDFQSTMVKTVTLAGSSEAAMHSLSQELLSIAPGLGRGPQELAEALYQVESSGVPAAQALKVVTAAAKGAALGLGETKVVADAVTSVLNAYGQSADSAALDTAILAAAVREGKGEADAIAGAIGRVIPLASQLGISFDQVAASVAALTRGGLSAEEAVTAVRGAMTALLDPSAQAEKLLAQYGFSVEEVQSKIANEGLLPTLFDLKDAFGENDRALAQLFPNVRGLIGVLSLTGSQAEAVEGVFQRVAATTSGELNSAFERVRETAGFKLKQAFSQLQVSLIEIGAQVAPVAEGLATVLRFAAPLAVVLPEIALAFLAWKAFTFVPILLQTIAFGLDAIGVAGGAATLTTISQTAAMTGLASAAMTAASVLAPVAIGLAAIYTAYKILSGGDPTFVPALSAGLVELAHNADGLGTHLEFLESKVGLAQDSIISWADSMRTKLASAFTIAQQKVTNFAHMTDEDLTAFSSSVLSSVDASVGSLTSLGAKWSLTSRQAVNAMDAMATKAGAIGRDFRRLDDEAIPQKFQAFLLTQGPDAVHAYVGANKQGQADMLKSWKTYQSNMAQIQAALVSITRKNSTAIGLAITQGTAQGIAAGTPAVMAAAAAMANRAEQAAMDALGARSPSKVMMDVGSDFTIGFAQGIESEMSTVISAIQAVVGQGLSKARLLQAKELEAMASDMASKMTRMVDAVQKDWDRLHSMIDDFKSSVRSGFDTLDILGGAQGLGQKLHDDLVAKVQAELDAARLAQAPAEIIAALEAKLKATTDSTVVPSAADFATFLKDQLATAQQFASALTQLQSLGLNQGLLSELASQGPASLPFLQALISGGADVISQFNDTQSAIDKIAGKTAGSLADDIFGKRLAALGDEVSNLQDRLAAMAESLASRVANFIDAIRADAVGIKIDDVIHALDQLAKRLDAFHVPGPSNGPGSTSTQSAPYVPGLAAVSAAGVTASGMRLDDETIDKLAQALDGRPIHVEPVMVREEFDRSAGKYISRTGAGRRGL